MNQAAAQPSRRYPRLRRSRPVLLKPRASPQASYGRLAVVGRGGAEVLTVEKIEPGTSLDVEIYLAGGYIEVQGRTTSYRRAAHDHLVGIAFTNCSPDQEILLDALLADQD